MAEAKRKLTVKQKKFVKAYVANDGNGKQAYKTAYGVTNDNTAAAEASTTLTKPNVKEAIEQALIKHEITMDAAIKPIADGLIASQEIVVNGKVVATRVDHSVRLKASGMALKLMGAEQKADPGGNTFLINNASFNSGKYTDGN